MSKKWSELKGKLSSVQRRLLEEEEIALDIPDEELEAASDDPGDKTGLDDIPVEKSEPDVAAKPAKNGDDTEQIDVLTKEIDELEAIKTKLSKKGILLAMKFSDFSTQRRLDAISEELGSILQHLNDKVLKNVAKSPMDVDKATSWLSQGGDQGTARGEGGDQGITRGEQHEA
jgi:hypothetical protein